MATNKRKLFTMNKLSKETKTTATQYFVVWTNRNREEGVIFNNPEDADVASSGLDLAFGSALAYDFHAGLLEEDIPIEETVVAIPQYAGSKVMEAFMPYDPVEESAYLNYIDSSKDAAQDKMLGLDIDNEVLDRLEYVTVQVVFQGDDYDESEEEEVEEDGD